MSDSNLILEVKGLNKWFGATYANKNIDFQLRPGEVRGLAGENGSGKSTLLTQIAGIQPSDSGEMFLNGTPYKPRSPLDATSSGVAIVVQELGLVPNLPAGINVFLGNTKRFSRFGIINNRKVYEAANQALSQWGLPPIPFQRLSGDMNVESRKMVELARALASDPQILILDELTQSLSHDNRTVLYELIRKFKEMGRSIILISHDLEEMLKITDSVSILKRRRTACHRTQPGHPPGGAEDPYGGPENRRRLLPERHHSPVRRPSGPVAAGCLHRPSQARIL